MNEARPGNLFSAISASPCEPNPPRPPRLPGSREDAEQGLTRRRGERGGSEGAWARARAGARAGWFGFYGAAETSRRIQGSCDVVVCSGRVRVRGVKPASPGRLPGGMSTNPTGRIHIQHER